MGDSLSPGERSWNMSRIGRRDTHPELLVRSALHVRGFRFSRNPIKLPGSPDVVLTKWRVAVFVHGCFWHWHGCHQSKVPGSNTSFWTSKLTRNKDRDVVAMLSLVSMGWRVATIWECALRGSAAKRDFTRRMDQLAHWIRNCPQAVALEVPEQ